MFFNNFINFIFPNCCYGCGEFVEDKYICDSCFSSMLEPTGDCLQPRDNELFNKLCGFGDIDGAFSIFRFKEYSLIRKLIHRLKYESWKGIGVWVGECCGRILLNSIDCGFDYVIPVPLYNSVEVRRGYNQSERICFGMSRVMSVSLGSGFLRRVKNTRSQTFLNREERLLNVKGAFIVNDVSDLERKRILLVDDVITTGSTILECVKTIKSAVKCNIVVCSVARPVDS